MRRFAYIFGAALPLLGATGALAEDVLIRIEAKRGSQVAQSSAERWSAKFNDVVTFPLSDGWIGIGLGPLPRDEATNRLRQLKAGGAVPGDSFLAPAGRNLTRFAGQPLPAAAAATPAPVTPVTNPTTIPLNTAAADSAQEVAPVAEPAPVPQSEPEPAKFYLRIDSTTDRAKADEILAKWRETLPEVGIWTLSNGRYAIAMGPLDETVGEAWLAAFRRAGAVPKDAFLAPAEEIGDVTIPGTTPELGAPPVEGTTPVAMPPLEDIQRALRWAGHYDGSIDGKDGPMTQTAIADEIVNLRTSPDTATAMIELIRRREAWRSEMGLTELRDTHTGLAMPVPMDKLQFDRAERALSIYGPKDGSGAALILFSQTGGQQEMLDLAGLVTALGWVPTPTRQIHKGTITLDGRNDTHISHAEARVIDGRVQGFVLIWPERDPLEQRRISAEIADNLTRFAPAAAEAVPETPVIAPAAIPPAATSQRVETPPTTP
ncbi:peptidoglycan-binding domain-containing protein [Paracoccus aestuariivivens]|uniref:Peptidoglycan-binding protein n=1 Tax=Paracoccus aestuariivivens TaxID=1820333 RepID=A0A6L6J914_9RHOB|nr:peptidoglycan-binding domain-containing protein [Paracoccus aestuariivivens]MTH76491.1 peptidoglycan-binding protein [Paracoccus aestuariivivens]